MSASARPTLVLVPGATAGFYYTTDRRFRISSLTSPGKGAFCAASRTTWEAVVRYATPEAGYWGTATVVEAATLAALKAKLAAYIAANPATLAEVL